MHRYLRHPLAWSLFACSALAHADTVRWLDFTGFWDDATRWDGGTIPTAGDTALIDPAGTRTVTVRANGSPFVVDAIDMPGDDTLALSGATLTVNSASSFANFTHGTGVLSSTADIDVTGNANLAFSNLSSVMTGAGTTTLHGTTTMGGYAIDNGRILRNEGTLTLGGGVNLNRFDDGGAGRIDNAAGAVFDIRTFNQSIVASALADLNARDGFPAFNNAGTLRRSTSGTYTIAVTLHNTGLLELLSGGLNLSAGGTQNGAVTLADGTVLTLGGGTHAIEAGASYTGTGTLRVAGNAFVRLNAATTVDSAFDHATGSISGADLTLNGPTTLALSNLSAGMTGPGTTTLNGNTAIGGYAVDNGRILRNAGTVTLTGGIDLNRVNDAGAGRIDNAENALFDIKTFNTSIFATAHADLNARPDFPAFNNAGTLRRSSSGTYTIGVQLNNAGLVELLQGNLNLGGGSLHAGSVTLADGSTLGLNGGTHVLAAGASFTGLGTVALAGAGTVLHADVASTIASGFSMTGGTIEGADLVLAGPARFAISSSLGVMAGPGTTTLLGDSAIGGGANNPFGLDGGRVLRNEGAAVINGVIEMNRLDTPGQGSGRIVNTARGVIDVQTFNQSIRAEDWGPLDSGLDALIENAGTFKKSTSGNYTVGVQFENTGTVAVEAGSLSFLRRIGSSGTLSVANGSRFVIGTQPFVNAGAMKGNGTFAFTGGATLTNAGLLAPGFSVGAIAIEGDYAQTADGVYEVELASLLAFDTLDITGDVALDGLLRIVSLDGYTPAVGDSFTIATFDQGVLSGAFANLVWQGFAPGIGFDLSYLDHALVLNAVPAPVPLPPAGFLMAGALCGLLWRGGLTKPRQHAAQ